MNALPLRLPPGSDLRRAIEDAARDRDNAYAFVLYDWSLSREHGAVTRHPELAVRKRPGP